MYYSLRKEIHGKDVIRNEAFVCSLCILERTIKNNKMVAIHILKENWYNMETFIWKIILTQKVYKFVHNFKTHFKVKACTMRVGN